MDVIFDYPNWLFCIFYSLPTLTWLFSALTMQIFTTKCLMLAINLSKNVEPSKIKPQDRKIELITYSLMVGVTLIYLITYIVTVSDD